MSGVTIVLLQLCSKIFVASRVRKSGLVKGFHWNSDLQPEILPDGTCRQTMVRVAATSDIKFYPNGGLQLKIILVLTSATVRDNRGEVEAH